MIKRFRGVGCVAGICTALLVLSGVLGFAYAQGGSGKKSAKAEAGFEEAGKKLIKGFAMMQGGIMMIKENTDVAAGKKIIVDGRKLLTSAAKTTSKDEKLLAYQAKVNGLNTMMKGSKMVEDGALKVTGGKDKDAGMKLMDDGLKMMMDGRKTMMGEK